MDDVEELRARHVRDSDDPAAYRALVSALTKAGRLRECAEIIERWAERRTDPIEAARASADAGELRERLEDHEKARKHYARALELDPRQPTAAAAFVRVSEGLRDVHRHIEIVERWAADLAARKASATERSAAEIALARATSAIPGRLDKALAHYRAAVELDVEAEPILDEAVDKARKARRTQDVRALLTLAAQRTRDPSRRVTLLHALADSQKEPPVDPDGMVETFRTIARLAPDDVPAHEALASALLARANRHKGTDEERADRVAAANVHVALARLATGPEVVRLLGTALDLDPANDVALSLLERLATNEHAETALVLRLEARIASSSRDASIAFRRKLASLHAKNHRPGPAFDALEPLLGGRPEATLALEAFNYARDAGRLADAVHLVEPAIDTHHGRRDALRGLVRRASKVGDLLALAEASRLLLAIASDDDEALAGLMEFHSKRNEPTGTRAWLERRITATTDPVAKRDLLHGLVALAEGPLKDEALATDAFQKLAELDPRDTTIRTELAKRLGKLGRLRALAEVRVWEATQLDGRDERKAAIEALRAIDAKSPLDSALLLRALRAYRTSDPADPDVRRWLIEIARDAGELDEVVVLLREEIRASRDDARLLASLKDLAELLERNLRDDDAARMASLHVLDLAATDVAEVERLERIATRSGLRPRIVEACARRAASVPPSERIDVLLRLAALHEQDPPDAAAAIEVWKSIRALEPDRVDAAEALLRLYGETGLFLDAIVLLDEIAAATADPEIRISALRERSRILDESIGDRDTAADGQREIRSIREDPEAWEWLVTYARSTARADELADLLAARLATTTDDEERRALSRERGMLLLEALLDPDAAERELIGVHAVDPTDTGVLDALAKIYEQTENAPRLATVTGELLALASRPEDRATLARRLVVIHERVVIDPKKSLDANRIWVESAPDDLDALRGLAERLDPETDADELVRVLDARANELGRRMGLQDYRDSTPDAVRDEAFGALVESADVSAAKDLAHAEERLRSALDIAFDRPFDVETVVRKATEIDVRLASEHLRRSVATNLARRAVVAARPTKDRLFLASADVFGAGLSDGERAFEVLRRALEECADSEEVRRSLVDYGLTSGFEDALDQALERAFEGSVEATTTRALLRERANLLYTLGRYDLAADQYQRLTSMDATDERARTRLRECLVRAERFQDLVIALEQALRRVPTDDVSKRATLLREVARTWEGPLGNRFEALDAWRKLAAIAPSDPEAKEAAVRLAPRSRVGADSGLRPTPVPPSPARSVPPPTPRSPTSIPPPIPRPTPGTDEGQGA